MTNAAHAPAPPPAPAPTLQAAHHPARAPRSPLWPLLASFSWQELRQHPWRNAAAVVSVMLGVALAFAVHVINASALDEFAQAVRSVSGQADLTVSNSNGARIPDALYGRLSHHPDVAWASPVLEINSYALAPSAPKSASAAPPQTAANSASTDAPGVERKVALRVLGVDALQIAAIAPDLLPLPGAGADRLDVFAPDAVFLPARMAARLPPAQTLKGLGAAADGSSHARRGLLLLLAAAVLAALPPVAGVPLAAYVSVALLLLGGIGTLPWLVSLLLKLVAPWVARHPLPLLAVERARRVPHGAAIAVSGVVASLSLAVALTVMVASFRQSVTQWLDTVLPAALYVRTAGSASSSETAFFDPRFVAQAAHIPGVERVAAQRTIALALDPAKPTVALLVRPLRNAQGDATSAPQATDTASLPLVGEALPVPPGRVGIYVSEAMVDLYGARLGQDFEPLGAGLQSLVRQGGVPQASAPSESAPQAFSNPQALARPDAAQRTRFFVAGVWRDYARQFGTVVMDSADFGTLSDDRRTNDLSLWLKPGADEAAVTAQLRARADSLGDKAGEAPGAASDSARASALLDFGSAGEIRQRSLQIFDRSFAVTYWLQAVAIGIGLFGVAASFSAQVLARRKEFGLLMHLGLTRAQVLRLLALEGAAWTLLGAIAGTALGLAVAAVLVFVVNPQSFHWTMDLTVPWLRLLALAGAVVVAGTATAWVSGRSAAGQDAVMAVKEDW